MKNVLTMIERSFSNNLYQSLSEDFSNIITNLIRDKTQNFSGCR